MEEMACRKRPHRLTSPLAWCVYFSSEILCKHDSSIRVNDVKRLWRLEVAAILLVCGEIKVAYYPDIPFSLVSV